MGRRSLQKSPSATSWLPGFEPESVSQQADIAQMLVPIPDAPPSTPSPVAIAAVQTVAEALDAAPHITLPREPQVIKVFGAEEALVDPPELSDALAALQAEEVSDLAYWPAFDAARYAPPAGEQARIKTNLQAIELAKQLNASGSQPDDEQRHKLLQYAGWGGLARIFEALDKNPHKSELAELQRLLTDKEFASARSTVTDAFYTSPVLVEAMWEAIKRFGFEGGRIIEPTAGTGLFLAGMPAEIAARSEITAIEKDAVSGSILTAAFRGLQVHPQVCAVEKASLPRGFYDLAISNVPFGDFKVAETRKVGYASWNIHNYVAGLMIDLVRPGGIVALITTRHALDSNGNAHRKWMQAHAEFIGAVRLPHGTFQRHAGTDVVADILFMRKRERPLYDVDTTAHWLTLGTWPKEMAKPGQEQRFSCHTGRGSYEVPRPMNAYFVKRPGMVLGKMVAQSSQYGGVTWVPEFDGTQEQFADKLREALGSLPEGIYKPVDAAQVGLGPTSVNLERVDAKGVVKPGSFLLDNGKIHLSEGATWIDVDDVYAGKARERVLGLMKLRDAARRLIDQQATSQDDAEFKRLQFTLNTLYDSFICKHGYVHDRANVRLFRSDPEFPLLLSLEQYDEDTEKFNKAAIFDRRTVGHREPPATAANPQEAMMISLAVYGRIELKDMARRLGVSVLSVIRSMEDEGLAYRDPEDHLWKPADEYLSGHIRNKIAAAQAGGRKFERNVKALEAVLPPDLGPADVEVRLGAPWVPTGVIGKFTEQLIKAKDVSVTYDAGSATWSVKAGHNPEWAGDRTLNCTTWGTADRCAVTLLEAALNQVPPKITRTDANGSTYVDKKATLAAREKYEAIKQEFRKWAYADEARRDGLLRIYNDEFNQVVNRRYDGSHLLLPGMSGAVVPYQHQLDAIWRIICGGNTLLAHPVGAGKTFTMAAACMEMRRLGKAAKPVIVVPNHLLEQITGDVVRFYPQANVLMASKEDLQGEKRKEFCARIATGDWDVVVMTHSTFERLPLRPQTLQRFLDDLMSQARIALDIASDSGAKRTVKQCEKILKTFEAKMERAAQAGDRDDLVYFDDLGVDFTCIDEAHLFKNLMRISKMPPIAGLPTAASNRAFDLWAKSSVIMEVRGGKEEGLVLSTATPIANSVAELHVMMKYCMPETLRRLGLYEFDAWASTFGEAVTGMEVSPDGSGYRLNTRFSRFVNTPELMAIFRLCADIKTRKQIKLPVPAIKGDKPQTIVCEPSEELKAYTKELVERADKIRNGEVKPAEDNMLAVTGAGRKAALDMRLVMPGLPFDKDGKVATIAREITRIYNETHDKRGTQVAFCDLSTPSQTAFSVYNDLRLRLTEGGIPANEIEFIHDHDSDAAKEKLFRSVRGGTVRVIMGSTAKLGTGTNFQKRLKAVHQLDQPWRPSDVEQRDGRGRRPGNEWEEIELLRYVTRGSFDAYQAQTLEVKAKFIEQIMSGEPGVRTVEDISMGALTYAEIKAIASGNPLVLEKATVDAEILKLSSLESSYEDERWRLSHRRRSLEEAIATIERNRQSDEDDARDIKHQLQNGWVFKPYVLSDKARAAATLTERIGICLRDRQRGEKVFNGHVGTVAGWEIGFNKNTIFGLEIDLRSTRSNLKVGVDTVKVSVVKDAEMGQLILDKLATLTDLVERQQARHDELSKQLTEVRRELGKEFEHAERLQQLILRQREIESLLDLDKDEAGTETAKESEGKPVAVAEEA